MSIYHLRIELKYTKPPIWRRVAVASDTTLGDLHQIIQIVMGWTDCHLHAFTLHDQNLKRGSGDIARLFDEGRESEILAALSGIRRFGPATTPFGDPLDMDGEDESSVTIGEVCPKVKSKLEYEYDFGDSWEHLLTVQKIVEPDDSIAYPVCLAGKKAGPPEDCGGIPGYYHMLDALADSKHEQHDDIVDWFGSDFDPDAFDLHEVNDLLNRWRQPQPPQKTQPPQLRLHRGDE